MSDKQEWYVVHRSGAYDDVYGPFPSLAVARVYMPDSESVTSLRRVDAGHYESPRGWALTRAMAKREGFDVSQATPMAPQNWWFRKR